MLQGKISFEAYFWLWHLGCLTYAKIRMPLVGLNAFSLLTIWSFASFLYNCFTCRAFLEGMSHTYVCRNLPLKEVIIASILIFLLAWLFTVTSYHRFELITTTMKK